MNRWVKNLIGITAALIFIIVVLIIGSIFMLQSSLPEYSGEQIVENIKNETAIYRDEYGVAYIISENEMDAYYALGYAHAQERLFQMDLSRRAGQGKLSEIFGTKTIFFDKMFRTIGLSELAKQNYSKYDSLSKQILISYADGVNEFITNSPDKFTIEFDLLGYKPSLWKPEHSLIIAKLMAWELNISWWSDIALSHLIQKLGEDHVKDILPTFDENSPPIIPENYKRYSNISLDFLNIDKKFRNFIGMNGTHIGSNNWVVNGEKSESGKPIIANDPHLSFSTPGKWYVVSLQSENLNADGFTLPGVPGVVIGRNKNISWVVTNVMADDADFYIEKLDSLKEHYYFNDEWLPLTVKKDTISVKDSSAVIFSIRKNHRGPIISDIHTYNKLFQNEEQKRNHVSMKWSALDFSNELLSIYKINHAQNWKEFNDALELFHSPGQNFVYADKKGNIGYVAGVKLPKRKSNSPTFISDGLRGDDDWVGYVNYSENPRLYNPAENFIASANNKTIDDYPYHISNLWEPRSRITRITELLKKNEKHSSEDFKKYQNDFFSHYAKDLVPYILSAFENYKINDKNLSTSLQILDKWDYMMNAESQVPSIYAVFFQHLMKNIFEDEMGEQLFNEYIFLANIPYRVVTELLNENSSDWFDDIHTEVIENRDEIIRKSLIQTVEYLEDKYGDRPEYWQWGEIHNITFKHFFNGTSSLIDKLVNIGPFKIGGDGTTVFNTEYSFTDPFECKLGPSMRFIYDFSKPNEFEFILPTGQSGHFFNKHYNDMTELWLKGEYIRVNTNIDTIKSKYKHLLKLIPSDS